MADFSAQGLLDVLGLLSLALSRVTYPRPVISVM